MTVDPGIERRIERLENEAVAIYDLIKDENKGIRSILSEHGHTLAEHGDTLAEHGQTLAEHTRTLAEHTQILNEHTQILGRHGEALAEILRRLPDSA